MAERPRPSCAKAAVAPLVLLCIACTAPAEAGHARSIVAGDTGPPARYLAARDDGSLGARREGPAPGVPDSRNGDEREDEAVELEAELELTADRLRDVSLDTDEDDDVLVREAELVAAVGYRPGPGFEAFGEVALIAEREDSAGTAPDESVDALERGETWIGFPRAFGTHGALKLGRQAFEDPRLWWWDEDLDAVRLDYGRGAWDAHAALAEELTRTDTSQDFIEPESEDVRRLIMHAGWRRSAALQLDLFALVQRDRSGSPPPGTTLAPEREDESDLDARWLGLRVSGTLAPDAAFRLRYWADIAGVSGDETLVEFEELSDGRSRAAEVGERRLRGRAVDLGTAWTLPIAGHPELRLGYAQGSGDPDPDDGTDRAFRETGLRDPDEEFRLYGELLRPELSNMRVATVALEFTALPGVRTTLGYHRFRQVHAAAALAETRLELEPTGESRDLGDELSVVVEIGRLGALELELAAAAFRAGDAFGVAAGRRASSLFAQLRYGF